VSHIRLHDRRGSGVVRPLVAPSAALYNLAQAQTVARAAYGDDSVEMRWIKHLTAH